MRLIQIEKLTPDMRPTGGLLDLATFIEPLKARIAIGLQCSRETA
jgi:hypothetical protein